MEQPTPDAASPERRRLDLVAVMLMLIGYLGLAVTLAAVHPLLVAGYVSLSVAAAGVALGMSR
ncbi:hypothetical protein [Streptosporangium sp. NPDC051022]|uniref:hypothetical protein n=1 Tax=Streptosporangium sp. NPDC051022 TaxID=3155752 RepID=UPI003432AB61